ncbi:fungal-specific transcription factor domain-containing protein [Jackrogersella minutella]|nr:fungal-specific transcription factor domain-containing protein [Jackrogersella minutella]
MFTTFIGTPQSLTRSSKNGRTGGTLVSSSPESPQASVRPPSRPKRPQVAHACDWCRVHRVKCDNNLPCKNCQSRGWQCSNKGSNPNEARTLAQANRDIERLKQQVNELKEQLEEERNASNTAKLNASDSFSYLTPSTKASSPTDLNHTWDHVSTKKTWDGVHTSAGNSRQKVWYGPSSLFYFISRMNTYLTSALQQLHVDEHIQLNSVAKSFPTPDCSNPSDGQESPSQEPGKATTSGEFLTPTQEEYFLNLFWQSYHSSLLVLNELDFKEQYKSLWATPGKPRKPSALVDIVIAMSMQYGMASTPRSTTVSSDADTDDPTIAGRWYYRRCQSLLASELESPTISTLQCQILSVIYLCCASFQNMAHSTLALAVRTAQMLGLHSEPAETVPLADKEMRKRLYWSLYTVESKTCMKLGRPFSLGLSSTLCSLPSDDHTVAILAGSDFAPLGETVTWLSYNLHNTKLVLAARAIHTALYDKYSDVYNGAKGNVIYDDLEALERYADFLATTIKALDVWAQAVPGALKTKRERDGVALSTDRSPLDVERFAPLWLQRQRLLLELLYHNLAMNLYRPFILFPSAYTSLSPPYPTPVTQSHADSAVSHSMAITQIMHQMLTETDILNGWHEAFQWQWNASLTLAGYLFAYPNSSIADTVRKAADRAVAALEIFGRSFAAANSAAAVMRDLVMKVDFLTSKMSKSSVQVPDYVGGGNGLINSGAMIPTNEDNAAMQSMPVADITFCADSSNELEMLWAAMGNVPEEWGFNFGAG